MESSGRLFAIGDVHGEVVPLIKLLEVIDLRAGDRLVCLGDYIHRGSQSKEVVDTLMDCPHQEQLVLLRGNHEMALERCLSAPGDKDALDEYLNFGGQVFLDSFGVRTPWDLSEKYQQWFQKLRWYFEEETFIFVHASVDPSLAMEDQDSHQLCWEFMRDRGAHVSGKKVICGHTPTSDQFPQWVGSHTVMLDTGCGGDALGYLSVLELRSMRYWQCNVAGELRDGWLVLDEVDFEEDDEDWS